MAEERYFITDEVVIPITAVESATHEQVLLTMSASDVRKQEPYLSYRMKPLSAGGVVLQAAQAAIEVLAVPNAVAAANKPDHPIEIAKDDTVMRDKTGHRLRRLHDRLFDHGDQIGR